MVDRQSCRYSHPQLRGRRPREVSSKHGAQSHFGPAKYIVCSGATLRILAINLDTATPTGKLMLNVLASVAQFEREVMLERQREGVAKAKAEGKYKGRKPTARAKSDDIIKLAGEGVKREDIAKRLGIGVASVYRVLASTAASAPAPDALSLALARNPASWCTSRVGKASSSGRGDRARQPFGPRQAASTGVTPRRWANEKDITQTTVQQRPNQVGRKHPPQTALEG